MENTNLNDLSKEDLIKVIANMHDTIQEWDNGYGLSREQAKTLINIGEQCTKLCSEGLGWEL